MRRRFFVLAIAHRIGLARISVASPALKCSSVYFAALAQTLNMKSETRHQKALPTAK